MLPKLSLPPAGAWHRYAVPDYLAPVYLRGLLMFYVCGILFNGADKMLAQDALCGAVLLFDVAFWLGHWVAYALTRPE